MIVLQCSLQIRINRLSNTNKNTAHLPVPIGVAVVSAIRWTVPHAKIRQVCKLASYGLLTKKGLGKGWGVKCRLTVTKAAERHGF
jgi:hypothetical protein